MIKWVLGGVGAVVAVVLLGVVAAFGPLPASVFGGPAAPGPSAPVADIPGDYVALYRAAAADTAARAGRERPKLFAVERSPRLRAVVCQQLRDGWSPATIAGR